MLCESSNISIFVQLKKPAYCRKCVNKWYEETSKDTDLVCLFRQYMSFALSGGEQADPRMRAHAIRRGYVLDSISRPVRTEDFFDFDLIIGMDNRNVDELRHRAPSVETMQKVHQMTEFSRNRLYDYVPDPYYSGAEGFELVLDLLEDACQGLLDACIPALDETESIPKMDN